MLGILTERTPEGDHLAVSQRSLMSPEISARGHATTHPKHGAGDDQAQERNPTEVEAPNAVQHIAAERWMEIDQGP